VTFLPHFRRRRGGETPRILSARGAFAPATNDRMMARRAEASFAPAQVRLRTLWSTMITMFRGLAMLLLALFGLSPFSPLVLARDADSRLPACCRRGGQHSCAMMARQPASSSGQSVQAARCRLFPAAQAIPPGRTVSLRGVSRAVFGGRVSHADFRFQAETLYRISYSRAGHGRAPPNSLL
jgi:hypothetical protein